MSEITPTSVEALADFYANPEEDNGETVETTKDEAEANTDVAAEALGETESDETPEDSEEDGQTSEDDDDTDEDTDAAEEEEESEELDLDQLVPVTVDGQIKQVSLKELQDGYLRQSDYTRKTQAHAQNVKAFESEFAELSKERAHFASLLPALEERLATELYAIDWDGLKKENPAQYLILKEEYQQKVNNLNAEKDRIAQEQQKVEQAAYQEVLQSEAAKLFEARPTWKDEKVFAEARERVLKIGESFGYDRKEMTDATDHRAILILDELQELRAFKARYEKISTPSQTNPVKKTPPVAAKVPVQKKLTAKQRAAERLTNRVGSVNDLAEFYASQSDD